MTARVVVSPMPGSKPVSVGGLVGYWRWRCEACGDLGYWMTADNAHDDGRAHAANCAALKYARLVDDIQGWADYFNDITELTENADTRDAWIETARVLTGLVSHA